MTALKKVLLLFMLATALGFAASPAEAASRMEAARRLDDFRDFFVDFQQAPDSSIPGDLVADCYGVIIMKQFRAGFVFGGEYGEGVVLLHDRRSGEWSPPAFVRSAAGNWGLQIGGQQTDAIVLIMNQDGVDMLLDSRFTIGVDASASAGPVGRDMAAAVGPGTALLTYARARGLFAGATLGGSAMFNNDGMNEALYGQPITVHDIINGRVRMPEEAYGLVNALKSYAVTNRVLPPNAMRSVPTPVPQPQGIPPQQFGVPVPGSQGGPAPELLPPMQPLPEQPAGAYY